MKNNSILLSNVSRIKDLSISSSFSSLILLNGYLETKDSELLNRAILIGNNIIENKTETRPYVYGGRPLTFIVGKTSMKHGSWGYDKDYVEVYPNDMLVNATFLIELSRVTKDSKYAEVGLAVIDSLQFIQDNQKDHFNGGLPYYLYSDDGKFKIQWRYQPFDIAYQVYLAGESAYKYTNDNKYKIFIDDYYNMVYQMLENGIYKKFTKNGKEYILPYEHLYKNDDDSYIGVNHDNYKNIVYTSNTDITMAQFFYFTLGMISYNPTNEWSKKFYETAKVLMNDNYFYWGEYTVDGNKGTADGTELEIINTAFMVEAMKLMGETKETYKPIICALIYQVEESTDKSINGAWTWSVGINDLIEGLATSWIIYEVYDKNGSENCCSISNNKVLEEHINVVEENPKTGVFNLIPIFLIITTISTILYLYINKKKIFKKM